VVGPRRGAGLQPGRCPAGPQCGVFDPHHVSTHVCIRNLTELEIKSQLNKIANIVENLLN
jgi:hypothetical protein